MAGQQVLRWVRALTLASVMLAAACTGHAAAGGAAPPTALLGPVLVVGTLAVAPFVKEQASAWRILALVVAGQAMLHVVLEVTGSVAPAHSDPMMSGAGMAQAMPDAPTSLSSMLLMSQAHLGMLVAHAAAALLVALWLAAGERAAWTLVGLCLLTVSTAWSALRDACVVTAAVVTVRPPAMPACVGRPGPRLRSVWDGRDALSRRGPPPVCAAA